MGKIAKQDEAAGLGIEKVARQKWVARYDPDVALRILAELLDGKSVAAISRMEGMPTAPTIRLWQIRHPAFAEAAAEARRLAAVALEEEALDQARRLTGEHEFTGTYIQGLATAIKAFQWSAERRDPAQYGAGAASAAMVPIQINTTLDLGGSAPPDANYRLEVEAPDASAPEDQSEGDPDPDPPNPFAALGVEEDAFRAQPEPLLEAPPRGSEHVRLKGQKRSARGVKLRMAKKGVKPEDLSPQARRILSRDV